MKVLRDVDLNLRNFNLRVLVFGGLVLFCFALITARLVYLQIFQHDRLLIQAENNRLSFIPQAPSRGLIYDRNGVVLTNNVPAYTLEIVPGEATDLEKTIAELSAIVAISPRDIKRFHRLRKAARSTDPTPIRSLLSDEEVARFAAQSYRFKGVELKARLFRSYPYGELGSHLLGYIGRINSKEREKIVQRNDASNYRSTNYIGKVGLERSYESVLHGTTGLDQIEITAGGFPTRKIHSTPAIPGASLHLSIDMKLQYLAETLFGDRRGALIAIDPNNGEVLALVSKPTFDPNIFLDGIDAADWKRINDSLQKPLLNRALRGTYPPGSTYKPFMGLAALESKIRSPQDRINDPGYFHFGNHVFRGHAVGPVNLHGAITHSSNVYFYSLANTMGVEAIHDFMQPFGFGQRSGIDLYGETRGILPNQAWKQRAFSKPRQQKWLPGETISLGIGQGYNNFTPLQLAVATATLANGGRKYTPHIVTATEDGLTGERIFAPPPQSTALTFKPENIDIVHKAMADVTKSGTAAKVFAGTVYTSAGKTGTAQAITIRQNEQYDAERLNEFHRDHSFYIAFAPLENPSIALAIIVENAGFGSASAAPIARRVFDYWLLGDYPSEEDIAAVQQGKATVPIGKPRKAYTIKVPKAGETYKPLPNTSGSTTS